MVGLSIEYVSSSLFSLSSTGASTCIGSIGFYSIEKKYTFIRNVSILNCWITSNALHCSSSFLQTILFAYDSLFFLILMRYTFSCSYFDAMQSNPIHKCYFFWMNIFSIDVVYSITYQILQRHLLYSYVYFLREYKW